MNYFIKVGKGSHMRTYVSTILIIFINLDFKRKILISLVVILSRKYASTNLDECFIDRLSRKSKMNTFRKIPFPWDRFVFAFSITRDRNIFVMCSFRGLGMT